MLWPYRIWYPTKVFYLSRIYIIDIGVVDCAVRAMKKWLEIFGLCRKKWLEIMDGGGRFSEQPHLVNNGVFRATSKRYELVLLLEISVCHDGACFGAWWQGYSVDCFLAANIELLIQN
jgi:hypothetical protein